MKLLYLYIYGYEGIFSDIGINFSADFNVSFSEGNLSVEKTDDSVKGYYGRKVDNVTLFLGKNGTGKSTLLDMLGMNRLDMSENTKTHNASYFLLYHVRDDDYALELTDRSFLDGSSRIKNISLGDNEVDAILYHDHMGIIIHYDSERALWEYKEHVIQNYLKHNGINSRLEYHYILTDTKTTRAVSWRDSNFGYLFNRNYYFNRSIYRYMFRYFWKLGSLDTFVAGSPYAFSFIDEADNNAIIGSSIDGNAREELAESCRNHIEELFVTGTIENGRSPSENLDRLHTPSVFKGSTKDAFVYYLCARAAVFYFFYQFINLDWITKMDTISEHDIDEAKVEIESFIAGLKGEGSQEEIFKSGNFGLQRDFHVEYALLLYMIRKYCPAGTLEGSKQLLEYVLGRYDKSELETRHKPAFMSLIDALEGLPDSCFVSWRELTIPYSEGAFDEDAECIEKFLDIYGACEEGNHLIRKILSIKTPGTSLGQAEFLGIISRLASALNNAGYDDNVILLLDEPDQSMHPEMSRCFMKEFLEAVDILAKCQVQIVMTSHSPFIITEIFTESVYKLEAPDSHSGTGIKIAHPEGTYAANIYKILMNPFMLKSTFGEYCRMKITEILTRLNSDEEIEPDELARMHSIILRVGEPVLRKKMLEKYYGHDAKHKLLQEIESSKLDDESVNQIREILRRNNNVQDRDN